MRAELKARGLEGKRTVPASLEHAHRHSIRHVSARPRWKFFRELSRFFTIFSLCRLTDCA
jgi:hypothetical protein